MLHSRFFLYAIMLLVLPANLYAQLHHEFLARVDYQTFGYTRIDSFPNVNSVYDNTAYDQNNKRFFLQGNNHPATPPWTLFTIDAQTGAMLSQATIPSNLSSAVHVCCLQYDNTNDTLYGIYYQGTSFSSCWIEPSTGIVHFKQTLPGIDGYAPTISAYDEIHHHLIFWGSTINGGRLVTVDALTGVLLATSALSASGGVCNLEYDNTNGHLYGVRTGTNSLDSIEVLTGIQHLIAALPAIGLMQNGISAIDEANHLYIFCGKTQPSNNDSLFTIDLQTGMIVNEQNYYGYANSASITGENIIMYCMDQLTGELYAINWGIEWLDPNGITTPQNDALFSLSPVPASSFADLQFAHAYDHVEVRVYNTLGMLVDVQTCEQVSGIRLSVENLMPGTYFVFVDADGVLSGVHSLIVQ
ncbi:hypothetical protein BH11BAC7_BH11BAC7_15060 [soil metagenome]